MPRARFKLETDWKADYQADLVLEELMKVGESITRAHKKDREKTIATWQGAIPAWQGIVRKRKSRGKVWLFIERIGHPFGKKKWGWLDEGTKVRYMHVSKDWKSKTRVGWIGSREGAGQTIGLKWPLPGIDARHWNTTINKKLNKRLEKRARTAIRRGLKRRRKGKFGGTDVLYV